MNAGKTLFAQVVEYVPWKTFGRIVERHDGDAGVRTLSCTDLFRVLVFSQLTWRESLRDISAHRTSDHTILTRSVSMARQRMERSSEFSEFLT